MPVPIPHPHAITRCTIRHQLQRRTGNYLTVTVSVEERNIPARGGRAGVEGVWVQDYDCDAGVALVGRGSGTAACFPRLYIYSI